MLWHYSNIWYIWEAKTVHWGTEKVMFEMGYENKCLEVQNDLWW